MFSKPSKAVFPLFLLLLICLPVIGTAGSSAGSTLILGKGAESYTLAGHLEVLEDKERNLTIKDVTSSGLSNRFRADSREVPQFGITSSVYWVKFTLEKEPDAEKQWLLELDYPRMDYADLYIPRADGSYEIKKSGNMRPFGIREIFHRNPVFPLSLTAAAQTFYLRAEPNAFAIFPLTLRTYPAFLKADYQRQLIFGLYFGIMTAMGLYNFFLFLVLRDRTYLYYVFSVLAFTTFSLLLNGFIYPVVFSQHPLMNYYFSATVTIFTLLSVIVFSRSFLHLAHYAPGYDLVFKSLLIIIALLLPGMFLIPSFILKKLLSLNALIMVFMTLAAGIACYRKGYYPARFFIIARTCFQLGVLLFVFGLLGVLPQSGFVRYGMQTGAAFDVILLSIALADRITVLRREKEKAEIAATRASQRGLVGEMAAGVAHEVNNPLSGIVLCFRELIETKEDDSGRAGLIEAIETGLIKIQGTMSQLLNLSRTASGKMKQTDLNALIHNVLLLNRYQLEKKGIRVVRDLSPMLPLITLDEDRIGQVLINMIFNASHAMDSGGVLTLRTVTEGRFCVVSISDTGKGIPPDVLGRIFEPFYSTKGAQGTGLGLSISKNIIEQHNGTIDVETTAGAGTTFYIKLPMKE